MSKRIFISYKRNTAADAAFVHSLSQALRQRGHQLFIDLSMRVGEDWVQRISDEIKGADYFVLVISEQAMQSQMVAEEARLAHATQRAHGRPVFLPVRLAYDGELPYDLGAILNRLNYALCNSAEDVPRVASELLAAIEHDALLPAADTPRKGLAADIPLPSANPLHCLEAPEGTMAAESVFYLERDADHIVADEQNHPGYTLTIQAARQMGKSSLLGRVMARARRSGRAVAFVDFQAFGHEELVDPKRLYHQFCVLIEDALGLDFQVDQHWQGPLSEAQKCRRFLERRILPQAGEQGLLLALDEADALLASPSRSDFFGMLRSWNNYRQTKPEWRRFCLATAISTEPAMLIESLTQSPFNVGTTVKLEDFSLADTQTLTQRHSMRLSTAEQRALHTLLCGHPYLTRKALYLLTKRRYSYADLLGEAASETGPFGDHLRALFSRLHLRPGLIDALRHALRSGEVDHEARHRLIAGGIVKEVGGRLQARNPLYDSYFRRVTKP